MKKNAFFIHVFKTFQTLFQESESLSQDVGHKEDDDSIQPYFKPR